MKGNLIWSMRTLTARFVEDENGKFEIVDGEIVPVIQYVVAQQPIVQIDSMKKIEGHLKTIADSTYKERNYCGAYGLP